MGAGATPQYCYEFWRAQGYERIVRAPLLANNVLLAVWSSHWQVAVNQFSLDFCKLITGSKTKLMHTLSADYLMECLHFALKKLFTVPIWRRIAAKDMPTISQKFSSDRTDDLVARLASIDHFPSPFPEFGVGA